MNTPVLSEFSYGFALVDELIHWHGTPITAVPVFPSLFTEGSLGYDVALDRGGVPLLLQFKLSQEMVRRRAKEFVSGHMQQLPFYRMHLHRRDKSDQHRLLCQWESAGNEVYYAAPEFTTNGALNDAYLRRQVRARSRFIRPSEIGLLPDDKPHHIAFATGRPGFVFCSEPEPKKGSLRGEDFDKHMTRIVEAEARKGLSPENLEKMVVELRKVLRIQDVIYGKLFDLLVKQAGAIGLLAYLAHAFFDCTLLIVRPKVKASP